MTSDRLSTATKSSYFLQILLSSTVFNDLSLRRSVGAHRSIQATPRNSAQSTLAHHEYSESLPECAKKKNSCAKKRWRSRLRPECHIFVLEFSHNRFKYATTSGSCPGGSSQGNRTQMLYHPSEVQPIGAVDSTHHRKHRQSQRPPCVQAYRLHHRRDPSANHVIRERELRQVPPDSVHPFALAECKDRCNRNRLDREQRGSREHRQGWT